MRRSDSTFWPSPSRLDIASKCGFAWSSNSPRWPKSAEKSTFAKFGTAFGRAVEPVAILGSDYAEAARFAAVEQGLTPSETTRLVRCLEHAAEDLARPVAFRAVEVPVLFDVRRGTARHADSWEQTWKPPAGHLGGTMDVVEIDGAGVLITDWKTGKRQSEEAEIERSWQLRVYGLMVARLMHAEEVTIRLCHVSEDGIHEDAFSLDALELDIVEAELRALLNSLEAAVPVSGRHCHTGYCKIVSVCPAALKALERVDGAVSTSDTYPMIGPITSAEHAVSVRNRLKMVQDAFEQRVAQVRAELEAYVEQHGAIELEPGIFYGARERKGTERVDIGVPGAISVVKRHLGDLADHAIDVSTSKSALEQAAKKVAKELGDTERGAQGRVLGPLLDDLRRIGALRQGAPYIRVEEYKRRGKAVETADDTEGEDAA